MNTRINALSFVAAATLLLAGDALAQAPAVTPGAGVNRAYMDPTVRPQDSIFNHANGTWLKNTQIPADHAALGVFNELYDRSLDELRGLIEAAAQSNAAPGSEERKIGDLYATFMDEPAVEAAGLGKLKGELAAIDAVQSKAQLGALFAHLERIGVDFPYGLGVGLDARDSTRYAVGLDQSGLELPDRDYYLKADDKRLADIKAKYQQHIAKMLGLADIADADAQAKAIVALETKIAQASWTKVELRDPVKTYNKVLVADLGKLTPGYDWKSYLNGAGVAGKVDYVIVGEPSYFKSLANLLKDTPLPLWKSYLKWQLLHSYAPYLSKAFVDENFAFFGTTLRGQPAQSPRWKRGIGLVEGSIGFGLGKLYVAKYFPPATKARMQALVDNLLTTYRQDIQTLDWMGPATRRQALEKLAKINKKIGYPEKWRDYSGLEVVRGDLVGDVMRSRGFQQDYHLNKLGKPVDHSEWDMTPQTINAYYDPAMNEIVFPAAILQPPFFDPKVDDAANYGSIGAVIGHEISHGFDDQGSQYDANGNLRDWWTKDDHQKFAAKTAALVAQYDAFEAIPGYHVNGKLTLGENIADNSGLAIAYKAWKLSLGGKPSPMIDGWSGDQRFFLSFAQTWRGKTRENALIEQLKSDPHSPDDARGTLPVRNQNPFYSAFGVKPGDGMYLPPDKRVQIW